MTNTTTAFLAIQNNLARYQKLTAEQPSVKTATAYYQANIGKVSTIGEFVGNYRLLSYALNAYGLGDQINNKALIAKVLEQGTSSPRALANTLENAHWKAFADAFNFSAAGSAAPASATAVATTTSDYVEQKLEENQGQSDPGVQLALYFARVAPTITNSLQMLADTNLTQVVQTIFNLPAGTSETQINNEAAALQKLMPVSELKGPATVKSLTERFTAAYDAKYGVGGTDPGGSLSVSDGNAASPVSAASSILSQVISSNSEALASRSSYTPLISPSLLASLALGG
ncbi:MAG TPA: DUF1217 domain-containing protein [Roseiarcus sp.]|nr:DUF1217 domain-containing protein [Roseiarcus sp.]